MKKLLKVILIPLFLAITFVFYLPTVKAQFDPDNDFPLLYLGFDATNIDLRNDPTDSSRSILVKKVEFTSPMNTINQLTVTFEDVEDLGIGEPAIYFLSGMVDNAALSTVSMTTMNINTNGGIGDNLFYFNYPYSDTSAYIMVYISIDKNLDIDYINTQQAIFDAIRFVPLAPYQYTKLLAQVISAPYTEDEILEMILLARFNSYTLGKDEGFEDGYEAGQDDMYANGSDTYGYVQANADDYQAGLIVGGSHNVNAGITNFLNNLDKWIVPAIVVVILLGGFVTIAVRKRNGSGGD